MKCLIIVAKYPRAGEAKTRLVPPLTFDEAALLARSFLRDTLLGVSRAAHSIDRQLHVAAEGDMEPMAALVAELMPGERPLSIRAQRGAGLGERLGAAMASAFAGGYTRVCIVGTDHPTLPASSFDDAFALLEEHDLVLGPAEDGGYYLLGLRRRCDALFELRSFSTPDLLRETMEAARREALSIALLPIWYDVDDAASLARLRADRALLPEGSETADLLAELVARGGTPRDPEP